jgi:hypothetical protein
MVYLSIVDTGVESSSDKIRLQNVIGSRNFLQFLI